MNESNIIVLSCFMYKINPKRCCFTLHFDKHLARMCTLFVNLVLLVIVKTTNDANPLNTLSIKLVKIDLKQCWSCLHHTQHVLNTNIKIHWTPNTLIQLTCNEKIKIVNNSHYRMKTYVVFHLHLIKQFFIEIQGWITTFNWKRGTWRSHL